MGLATDAKDADEQLSRKRPMVCLLRSTKTGSVHLQRLPAVKKIANYLPMVRPDATKSQRQVLPALASCVGGPFAMLAISVP